MVVSAARIWCEKSNRVGLFHLTKWQQLSLWQYNLVTVSHLPFFSSSLLSTCVVFRLQVNFQPEQCTIIQLVRLAKGTRANHLQRSPFRWSMQSSKNPNQEWLWWSDHPKRAEKPFKQADKPLTCSFCKYLHRYWVYSEQPQDNYGLPLLPTN